MAPSATTDVLAVDADVLSSETVLTAWTSLGTNPSVTGSHPLQYCDWRVVSAGIRVWLTEPFLTATGQFLAAVAPYTTLAAVSAATLYDMMGD